MSKKLKNLNAQSRYMLAKLNLQIISINIINASYDHQKISKRNQINRTDRSAEIGDQWLIPRFLTPKYSELKTLEWDTLNPDYLIWVSNGHTFDFLLKPFFLGYSREKSKTGFFHLESPSVSVYNLKWRQNFKFIDFIYATLIFWILYKFRIQVEV